MKVLKFTAFLMAWLCFSPVQVFSQKIASGSYYQEVSQKIDLPLNAGLDVVKLFKHGNTIKAITSHGIFYNQKDKWTGQPYVSGIINATADNSQTVWMNNDKTIWSEKGERIPNPPRTHGRQSITSTHWIDNNTLLAGTTHGLYSWNGTWEKVTTFSDIKINAITQDNEGIIWIAADEGLWQKNQAYGWTWIK
ncbi:hypothetical protein [Cyclobacterium qasimii]|uniref:Uncharacterized protein n=1 Tax=Cyclobacterium qasimii M12-11B TaxID=641524 RepID=S7WSX1_9BACT|nr:hypothetical protein [Cyclobacterium qasimii]EPR69864.1 hypothetical protein ADICYQ_1198 [Cyclobacterium qasimii M12-11B]